MTNFDTTSNGQGMHCALMSCVRTCHPSIHPNGSARSHTRACTQTHTHTHMRIHTSQRTLTYPCWARKWLSQGPLPALGHLQACAKEAVEH